MSKLTVLFLLMLIRSDINFQPEIHTELIPYHDRFVLEAKKRGVPLESVPPKMMFFENADTKRMGVCRYVEKGVYVNKLWWDNAEEEKREIIVFHELGHYYLHAGHIRHIANDIMNPDSRIDDWNANRSMYIDMLFMKIYETPVDRTDLTLRAGDIIITANHPKSDSFNLHILNDDTPENMTRSLALFDSIQKTHHQWDYINAKGWRLKTFDYEGCNPVIEYDAKINEVWGELSNMYMYQTNRNKSPKIGRNGNIRWNEKTEMILVVDGKVETVTVRRNATIMYYVRQMPKESDIDNIINPKK